MEKHEVIGDLPADLRAEECDLEALIMPHDEREWPKDWRAYAACFAGFCGMVLCWGNIVTYGSFFRYYDEILLDGRASDALIGLIGSVQAFLVLGLSSIVGRLLDAQYHRQILLVGGAVTTSSYLCLSFVGARWGLILLTQGFMAGFGMACFFTHSSYCAVQWLPGHKYIAIGITSTGASVGGTTFPAAVNGLIESYGFPNAVRWMALLFAAMSVICVAFGGPPPNVKKHPLSLSWECWINLEAFRNRMFLYFTLGMAAVYFGYSPLLFHVTEWAKTNNGLKPYWFLAIMNGSSIIGRLGSAAIASSDSKSLNPLLLIHAISCLVGAILVFAFWQLAGNIPTSISFCVLFGIAAGVFMGLPASAIAYIIPEENKQSLGTWIGMMWASCAVTCLTGPPIAGTLVQRYGIPAVGYWAGSYLLLATVLVGLAAWEKRKYDKSKELVEKHREGSEVI